MYLKDDDVTIKYKYNIYRDIMHLTILIKTKYFNSVAVKMFLKASWMSVWSYNCVYE